MNNKFIFYDYETFGINTALDKPSQFSSITTDVNFNIISKATVLYCYPPIDYLPDPESILVTGITPQYTQLYGTNESVFSEKINKIFTIGNSCIVGYNNIHFDDEITRNIFYRNFIDPYSWSWIKSNSRWDLLNVLRAYYALRPENIKWPINTDGDPSFKLQDITSKNKLEHIKSHDATSDVYATIQAAKMIKKSQPRLFNFLFKYRTKKNILNFISLNKEKLILYISSFFGSKNSNVSIIMFIDWCKNNNNIVIAFDLSKNIKSFVNYLKNTKISCLSKKVLFKKGLLLIFVNRCPVLAPICVLRLQDLIRLKINLENYRINFFKIKKHIYLFEKISNFLNENFQLISSDNVDLKIYQNFLCNYDKLLAREVRKKVPLGLFNKSMLFIDNRMKELLFRYKARNYPDTLNSLERKLWNDHCLKVLNREYLQKYEYKLKKMMVNYSYHVNFAKLLKKTFLYYKNIVLTMYLK